MGEAGPEARRGHHRRGARRRPALVVEFGEVGGEGLVVEPAAGEPGVEPAQSAGVRPAGVRGDGGRGEAGLFESPQMRVGSGGASSMPPQQRNSIEINAPGEWKP